MAAPASALKDYLKKYEGSYSDPAPEKKRKKKKKIKNNKIGNVGGIRVVDGDPTWQKPVDEDEEEEEDEMKEAQVTEDIEVKRLKRLEQLRARRPYLALSDDGSGWVSVSDERRDRDKRPDTSADLSPPRNSRRSSPPEDHEDEEALELSEHADLSPPRRHHRPSYEKDDVDLSSPRRSTSALVQTDTVDLSPPRKRSSSLRHDDVDLSPPRKRSSSLHKNSADLSSPRKHSSLFLPHKDVDLSPPRKRGSSSLSHDDVDKSPPRKHESSSSRHNAIDLSPPRKQRLSSSQHVDVDQSPPRKRNYSSISMDKRVDLPPPSKLAFSVKRSEPKDDARRHGLLSKQEMMEEISKKKKEETIRYSEMDPAMTGRAAEPVYRDHGRVISKEEYLKLHAKEEKPKEKKLEWGQGLVQKREAEARLKEITLEKERPFARGSDDPELDKMLKERVRWGDPMAHLVKRKDPDLELEDLGNDEKMKESGFVIPQAVPIHSWLRRGIDPPANRYGIRPGRHWDGVDRSNGFEREMFKRQNEKKATADESYLWSVADM